MKTRVYEKDGGINFGSWQDNTSKLLYASTLSWIEEQGVAAKKVVDLGGGTGIIGEKLQLEKYKVIDIDPSKEKYGEFEVGDITAYNGEEEVAIVRFVLHYLPNSKVKELFSNLLASGLSKVLLIQFVNEGANLSIKKWISERYEAPTEGEKYFRTQEELETLLEGVLGFRPSPSLGMKYRVTSEFYRNRFGAPETLDTPAHDEYTLLYNIDLSKGERK